MEETYTFKYDENVSKEFLTKISTNFVITKVVITSNKIIENDNITHSIYIGNFHIPIIENLINYFNNKIEYACIPYLSNSDLDIINDSLINNNSELWITENDTKNNSDDSSIIIYNQSEWIECEFIIKETKSILILDIDYNDRKYKNNLIIESNVFNNYDEFKNYFLTYTKITAEQYKNFILKYYTIIYDEDFVAILRFIYLDNNDNIIIFNDIPDNL
jgi:hypothetical protein